VKKIAPRTVRVTSTSTPLEGTLRGVVGDEPDPCRVSVGFALSARQGVSFDSPRLECGLSKEAVRLIARRKRSELGEARGQSQTPTPPQKHKWSDCCHVATLRLTEVAVRSIERPRRSNGGPLRRRAVSGPRWGLALRRFFPGYTELIRGQLRHGRKKRTDLHDVSGL